MPVPVDIAKGGPRMLVFACLVVASLNITTAEAYSLPATNFGGLKSLLSGSISDCCSPACASPTSLLTIAGAEGAIPLQPQVTQSASGLPLHVRLRGMPDSPLAFPQAGVQALGAVTERDFCPFSRAVSEASTERVAASITEDALPRTLAMVRSSKASDFGCERQDQLQAFHVPDSHVVELYDLPEGSASCSTKNGSTRSRWLASFLAQQLSLPKSSWPSAICVRETSEGASTAVVALRRATHARELLRRAAEGTLGSGDTFLQAERLREWRGAEFRPQARGLEDFLTAEAAHKLHLDVAATRRGRQSEKEVLAKMERDIATSSKALEALQAERSALQAALAKAEQEKQKFAEDEADLKSMRNRAETKAKQAKAERRSLESKLTELEAEANARTAELATALAAEKAALISRFEKHPRSSQAGKRKLEDQLAEERAARAAASSELKLSTEALELEQVAKVESEKRWEQIAADLSKQASYPSSTKAVQLEQKLVKLQEEAKRVEADHGQVVASLQAKSEALAKENQELKATATRLEKKVSSAQKEAEEELQQLSSSLKSEKARRAFHNRIAAFEHDVSTQAEERQVVASLQAKSEALAKENQELKATATCLEKKVSSAQKEAEEELQQLSSSLKSEKARRAFHNRIAAFEHADERLQQLTSALEAEKVAKAEAEEELACAGKAEKRLQLDHDRAVKSLLAKSDAMAEENESLKTSCSALEQKLADLRQEADEKEEHSKQAMASQQAARAELEELEERLTGDREQAVAELHVKADALTKENASLKASMTKLESKLKALRKEAEDQADLLVDAVEAAREEGAAESAAAMVEAEEKLEQTTVALANAEARMRHLQEKLQESQAEVQEEQTRASQAQKP
eukprot:s2863_g7.t3